MQKNAKNGTFFYKECKRTQRTERSFIKNAKERKERNILLKRTDAQPCVRLGKKNGKFFKKNGTFFLRSFFRDLVRLGWLG